MTVSAQITLSIRQAAGRMLSEGSVGVVVGYGRENGVPLAVPVFAQSVKDAERLVFDDGCVGNLAVYLSKKQVRDMGRVGIVVKGCDLRAVNVLLREHVIKREDIALIGVRCAGVGNPLIPKCLACDQHEPAGCDILVGDELKPPAVKSPRVYAAAGEIEKMPLPERWAFWREKLAACIRCYACRQICPLCYCKRCIVEKNTPHWVETSAHLRGNIAWNVARALHLTGRCVGCGECERVCPMHIPLGAINEKMARIMDEWYGFRSGLSADAQAPFTTFSPDDPEKEIL